MSFEFRLEKVRQVRLHEETEKAQAMRQAQEDADAAAEAHRALDELRKLSLSQLAGAHQIGATAGQIGALSDTLRYLEKRIEEARQTRDIADLRLQGAHVEYLRARSNRKALDLLEERQRAEWNVQQARLEEKENQEIARSRPPRAP